ncbi:MAG: S8 family peptidase [Allosphingosinicella sp.]|uniref:S8 family peptidase n=1 Tax=Allosphingosinicella sp. TaxID=2823234 RepID=UPI0039584D50
MATSTSDGIDEDLLRKVMFQTFGHMRYTQDSPVMPEVWLEFAKAQKGETRDLILTPETGHPPTAVANDLLARLQAFNGASEEDMRVSTRLAYNRTTVVARLRFEELICVVVPMTPWWTTLDSDLTNYADIDRRLTDLETKRKPFREVINDPARWNYYRFVVLAGFIASLPDHPEPEKLAQQLLDADTCFCDVKEAVQEFLAMMRAVELPPPDAAAQSHVWTVSLNRTTEPALALSRSAIKADAAQNLFNVCTRRLAWAVIDCGIDATHPAFAEKCDPQAAAFEAAGSRVQATYDFTYLRDLLSLHGKNTFETADGQQVTVPANAELALKDLRRRVTLGREIDWGMLLPIIQVSHSAEDYRPPKGEHGTHVAGILAGNWPANHTSNETGESLVGICPDLQLYDFRVFDAKGQSDEFTIMAALQAVNYLNRNRDTPVIHGVNLSLSLKHEVMSYACGRTPICIECSKLVGNGTVVVAAAGNRGYEASTAAFGSYRGISITDPGNAEAVITVGSTHRSEPHSYGVSYFSSRGPTGDGRRKPDLVAPGEKIVAPIPNRGAKRMDGTSMAAPHVSGAAALLMARNPEFIGDPVRIKDILLRSATDLGRERDFQGAGMLDILRALQLV